MKKTPKASAKTAAKGKAGAAKSPQSSRYKLSLVSPPDGGAGGIAQFFKPAASAGRSEIAAPKRASAAAGEVIELDDTAMNDVIELSGDSAPAPAPTTVATPVVPAVVCAPIPTFAQRRLSLSEAALSRAKPAVAAAAAPVSSASAEQEKNAEMIRQRIQPLADGPPPAENDVSPPPPPPPPPAFAKRSSDRPAAQITPPPHPTDAMGATGSTPSASSAPAAVTADTPQVAIAVTSGIHVDRNGTGARARIQIRPPVFSPPTDAAHSTSKPAFVATVDSVAGNASEPEVVHIAESQLSPATGRLTAPATAIRTRPPLPLSPAVDTARHSALDAKHTPATANRFSKGETPGNPETSSDSTVTTPALPPARAAVTAAPTASTAAASGATPSQNDDDSQLMPSFGLALGNTHTHTHTHTPPPTQSKLRLQRKTPIAAATTTAAAATTAVHTQSPIVIPASPTPPSQLIALRPAGAPIPSFVTASAASASASAAAITTAVAEATASPLKQEDSEPHIRDQSLSPVFDAAPPPIPARRISPNKVGSAIKQQVPSPAKAIALNAAAAAASVKLESARLSPIRPFTGRTSTLTVAAPAKVESQPPPLEHPTQIAADLHTTAVADADDFDSALLPNHSLVLPPAVPVVVPEAAARPAATVKPKKKLIRIDDDDSRDSTASELTVIPATQAPLQPQPPASRFGREVLEIADDDEQYTQLSQPKSTAVKRTAPPSSASAMSLSVAAMATRSARPAAAAPVAAKPPKVRAAMPDDDDDEDDDADGSAGDSSSDGEKENRSGSDDDDSDEDGDLPTAEENAAFEAAALADGEGSIDGWDGDGFPEYDPRDFESASQSAPAAAAAATSAAAASAPTSATAAAARASVNGSARGLSMAAAAGAAVSEYKFPRLSELKAQGVDLSYGRGAQAAAHSRARGAPAAHASGRGRAGASGRGRGRARGGRGAAASGQYAYDVLDESPAASAAAAAAAGGGGDAGDDDYGSRPMIAQSFSNARVPGESVPARGGRGGRGGGGGGRGPGASLVGVSGKWRHMNGRPTLFLSDGRQLTGKAAYMASKKVTMPEVAPPTVDAAGNPIPKRKRRKTPKKPKAKTKTPKPKSAKGKGAKSEGTRKRKSLSDDSTAGADDGATAKPKSKSNSKSKSKSKSASAFREMDAATTSGEWITKKKTKTVSHLPSASDPVSSTHATVKPPKTTSSGSTPTGNRKKQPLDFHLS